MHLMCLPKATLRLVHHLLNLMKFVEFKSSFQSLSKRELPKLIGAMKGHSNLDVNEVKIGDLLKKKLNSEDAKCLTQEICQLEKQLEDQLLVRSALEKAFTSTSFSTDNENDQNPITKPVMDLMKEISDLESQVVYLEKHLLSLYRETFDQNVPTLDLKSSHRRASSEVCWNDHCHIPSNLKEEHENDPIFVLPDDQSSVHSKKVMNSGINRCHSTLTGVDPYHSFPLSMLENSDDDDGTSSSLSARSGYLNHVSETPNWISEEMIKLISAIYCELASDPHFFARDSPQASFFSETDSSPHEDNYDHTECISQMSLSRSSSSLNSVVVMQFNYRDNPRLKTVKHMLWSFKLLVSRLERVDAKIMRYEEKLAFWINVHNALIMHAYIVYGIPYGNLRRKTSLVLKAAYIVGGHAISIEMIQNLILGCRLNKRQGQTYWLPSLFNLRTKSKGGSEHHVLRHYAVQQEEHRLYFALCSGSHSDPMVRVFTPDKVFEELEAAKEDYIRTNIVIVEKKQKIILPKIVYSFARDAQMSARALVDMIKPFLSDEGKRMKKIEWMSHNYDFRYLIAKELVK